MNSRRPLNAFRPVRGKPDHSALKARHLDIPTVSQGGQLADITKRSPRNRRLIETGRGLVGSGNGQEVRDRVHEPEYR